LNSSSYVASFAVVQFPQSPHPFHIVSVEKIAQLIFPYVLG
jgi:hypothetical protein